VCLIETKMDVIIREVVQFTVNMWAGCIRGRRGAYC
jgi:hypothetical protein